MVKFNLSLERDGDLETMRKAIKKVAVAQQADPRFTRGFIRPPKMPGAAALVWT